MDRPICRCVQFTDSRVPSMLGNVRCATLERRQEERYLREAQMTKPAKKVKRCGEENQMRPDARFGAFVRNGRATCIRHWGHSAPHLDAIGREW
jgi:hypothetical protein